MRPALCSRSHLATLFVWVVVGCAPREPTIRVGVNTAVTRGLDQRPPVEAHLAILPSNPRHLLGAAMMTVIEDACATHTQERHDFSLRSIKGYCRKRSTDEVLAELAAQQAADNAE